MAAVVADQPVEPTVAVLVAVAAASCLLEPQQQDRHLDQHLPVSFPVNHIFRHILTLPMVSLLFRVWDTIKVILDFSNIAMLLIRAAVVAVVSLITMWASLAEPAFGAAVAVVVVALEQVLTAQAEPLYLAALAAAVMAHQAPHLAERLQRVVAVEAEQAGHQARVLLAVSS
jgi:hypothetical protein